MASARALFRRAVTAHRTALGLLGAVRQRLEYMDAYGGGVEFENQQTALARRLAAMTGEFSQGWCTEPWARLTAGRPSVERDAVPGGRALLRIGDASPSAEATFPVIVPLVGVGHLTVDVDARSTLIAGFLQSLITRLLAAFPAGSLRILAIDGAALGASFAPFSALVPAGVMNEPATDQSGFRNALEEAEEQVRQVQTGEDRDPPVLLIVAAALPPGCGRTEFARLQALAHAGPAARVHLIVAGYPPAGTAEHDAAPDLEMTARITADRTGAEAVFHVADPPGDRFGTDGRGLNAPVRLDTAPPPSLVAELCRHVALRAESEGALTFNDLVPERLWQESSISWLSTVIGRVGRADAVLSLDDATPHWLVSGRTGSGKTVFLLDALYGLAARYSPDELSFYLLDFKEGVSFTEFIATEGDPTWIPHARAVGVESDRQYGVAVLQELVWEMSRRSVEMKKSGVTKLSELRTRRRDLAMPRIVTAIDEFHVLFQGNDDTAKRAAALLEDVARRGRSYGIHLILASQSVSGIEALFGRGQSVFGQFGMRIALTGGGSVLDKMNLAADDLPIGTAIINNAGGVKSGNRRLRFPYSDPPAVAELRHRIWDMRVPGSAPPGVFAGYAEYRLNDDPTYHRLSPNVRRRQALIGRAVEIGLPAVGLTLEASPGRHMAVLGTSAVGADILHAVTLTLAKQHMPGSARFFLVNLVAASDEVVDDLCAALKSQGHDHEVLSLAGYRDLIGKLTKVLDTGESDSAAYLVVFGADSASAALSAMNRDTMRSGIEDFRRLLREGPNQQIHVFGWWRGVRRFTDDLGPNNREDVAGIVAINVRGQDLGTLLGQFTVDWSPRPNRVLFVDKHEDVSMLLVPFVREGRYGAET